ncbi:MAG TPA: hypothetical protein VI233_04595 [Puia sp.]
MKQKFLYILGLLLCLSTFASSNERARNCGHVCPQAAAAAKAAATPSISGEVSEVSNVSQLPVLRLLSI